jgi:uncharacterized protein
MDRRSRADEPLLTVEVVYALPQRAIVKEVRLRAPATVADALAQVGNDREFDGIDLAEAAVGIFGSPAPRNRSLRDGDRIEIYRALTVDPKAARRQRAAARR